MWEEGCVVDGNNIVECGGGQVSGTVWMGRKIQRCRARCGTQLGQQPANHMEGKVKERQKKKSKHPPSEQGDLQRGRQGQMGTELALFAKKEKREQN